MHMKTKRMTTWQVMKQVDKLMENHEEWKPYNLKKLMDSASQKLNLKKYKKKRLFDNVY